MFGIGGLTGLPLGLNVADIPLHDTYYVIAHFHYVVAPGTIFALFAGIYYWYPKATGRKMNETLGKIHFVGSFVCMNVIFMPMFLDGAGRRLAATVRRRGELRLRAAGPPPERRVLLGRVDHGALPDSLHLQFLLEHPERGEDRATNPWQATTIEWAAPSPPPHGNFLVAPEAYRGPYEYSVPGAAKDFVPQFEA